MKRLAPGIIALVIVAPSIMALALLSCSSESVPSDVVDYVNPFIGTGGHGHTFPGATRPFGMVQLSPDTRLDGWDGCSGYHYSDNVVYGFSHTHLSGTGISDYADVLLMPTTGAVKFDNGHPDRIDQGYASRFEKKNEHATAGYYTTRLDDYNIKVELTATDRAGMHRYHFPATAAANVIVDLDHRDEVLSSSLKRTSDTELEGHRVSRAWAQEQHIYFVVRFSQPFDEHEIKKPDSDGQGHKASVTWNLEDRTIIVVKVGISAVSIDGARRNLDAEIPDFDFDRVRDASRHAWKQALGKIQVKGDSKDDLTIFYTSLYHTMIAPNLYSDVDGSYRGTDLKRHKDPGHRIYTVFSLWDTFRAAHPLYTIIEQERTIEFIETFLQQYRDGGQLPVWELAANYTGTMIGYHAIPAIVDAFQKGLTRFDAELALEAMQHIAELDELGKSPYRQRGFIPASEEAESVSKTLEYAYDDWCIAVMADALGHGDVARVFTERSQSFMNLFDPSTGFMRARTNGGWLDPFEPSEVTFHYTEANAWQYSFFVPHDIDALVRLMGGKRAFEQRLDDLFTTSSILSGRDQPDITGLIGQYAHGNEPSHHMAYLYNYIGKPHKTQQRIRQIMDEMYSDAPDGLSGNEDCGQMSAWYVLSAMGFYPVSPGRTSYAIGTPRFDTTRIFLESGKTFSITAHNLSGRNIYIQSATLNGEALHEAFINHHAIVIGGELVFEMGSEPNLKWGASPPAEEHIAATDRITPVPFITAASRTFIDSLAIAMGAACDCDIFYTVDGAEPTTSSSRYLDPFQITESATIKAIAVSADGISGESIGEFLRIPGGRSIELHAEYANQYAAGGPHGLIDYQYGGRNWRTGGWQGYWGVDFEAVVDLGESQSINFIAASFLQDQRSWIWLPTEVEFAISDDGERFSVIATISHDIPDGDDGVIIQPFIHEGSHRGRFIRVTATNYGVCPDWHPGAGGDAWIFIDEISVK